MAARDHNLPNDDPGAQLRRHSQELVDKLSDIIAPQATKQRLKQLVIEVIEKESQVGAPSILAKCDEPAAAAVVYHAAQTECRASAREWRVARHSRH